MGAGGFTFSVVFEDEFENAAEESGLSVEALLAVARRESALSPDAVSEVGARGLMQLMPSTARLTARKHNYRYSRSRLMRPSYNTAVGGLYYADLINNYGATESWLWLLTTLDLTGLGGGVRVG